MLTNKTTQNKTERMPVTDTDYADRLLEAAKSLYEFAKANPGKYTDVVPSASGFYA